MLCIVWRFKERRKFKTKYEYLILSKLVEYSMRLVHELGRTANCIINLCSGRD